MHVFIKMGLSCSVRKNYAVPCSPECDSHRFLNTELFYSLGSECGNHSFLHTELFCSLDYFLVLKVWDFVVRLLPFSSLFLKPACPLTSRYTTNRCYTLKYDLFSDRYRAHYTFQVWVLLLFSIFSMTSASETMLGLPLDYGILDGKYRLVTLALPIHFWTSGRTVLFPMLVQTLMQSVVGSCSLCMLQWLL